MSEWKEIKLEDFASLKYGKLPPKGIVPSGYPIWSGYKYVGSAETFNCPKDTPIVVARGVGGTGDVKIAKEDCFLTNLSISVSLKEEICNPHFFTYYFAKDNLRYLDSGSAQSQITIDALKKVILKLPPLQQQKKIVAVLSSLDEKIETNRKINARLEELAQALFKSWFIDFEPFGGKMPKDWEIKPLSNVATYLNGLAMQKYPPINSSDKLPVLKIKELGEGCINANSDFCSKANIGLDYIIENGDIIFSWSGTLLVRMWTGGKCGLNQHLFKVTSNHYPKWYYYFWTLHHNENFKRIAKDKAVTMGHIKREELDKAKVNVPSSEFINRADTVLSPILRQIENTSIESARLAALRNSLLPKLMSGEIKPE